MPRKKKKEKVERDPITGAVIGAKPPVIPVPPKPETRQVPGGEGREFVVVPEEEAREKALGREKDFISPETGRISGISRGGKTFLGLSPEEAGLIAKQQEGIAGQQSPAMQELIAQIGLTPEV